MITTLDSDSSRTIAQKRKEAPHPTGVKPMKKVKRVGPRSDSKTDIMADGEGGGQEADSAAKPKRVRTGCLTCRERHLKCDEGMPSCHNCRKSNRTCKRGVRLNFLETWVQQPPTLVTPFGVPGRVVKFHDDSRDIASEYQGGSERYQSITRDVSTSSLTDTAFAYEYPSGVAPSSAAAMPMPQPSLPPIQGVVPALYSEHGPAPSTSIPFDIPPQQESLQFGQAMQHPHSASTQRSYFNDPGTGSSTLQGSTSSYQTADTEPEDVEKTKKEYLDNQEDTLFMQVFVEEVGLWMDSMDPQKHFSRLLPFHSLSEPMLLNAFLACGAKHLTLVNAAYSEDKALHYYDTATHHLLHNLTNPKRDTVVCATTAVILNVYEIMSERALQRMNHIAGARALIKECGWNARAQGIGAACFWLNVGLEVLSCLHFNWQVAWDPDDWGLDMDITRELSNGREELWTHRMLYIIAKVCNFRATTPRSQELNARDEQIRMQRRAEEWQKLKNMCEAWNNGVPRTMQPMAFLFPYQTSVKSCFPEVWLVKRTTIVARLFYHTAMLLLAQIHPYFRVSTSTEMAEMQTRHSQMICGIVAHVKDRGVASVAIRSLAHAAEVLTDRKEQEEVIQIFEKINRETGWRIGFVYGELMQKWGWNEEPSPLQFAQTHTGAAQQSQQQQQQQHQQQQHHHHQQQHPQQQQHQQSHQQPLQADFNASQNLSMGTSQAPPPSQPKSKKPPPGITNPLYAKADFNLPQHPYQNFYVAPMNGQGFGEGAPGHQQQQQQQVGGLAFYGA